MEINNHIGSSLNDFLGNEVRQSVKCTICGQLSSELMDREYGIQHVILGREQRPEWLHFKCICVNCNDYITMAPAGDVEKLQKQVAKRLNPFRKAKRKSLWSRIKCLLNR